MEMQMHQVPEIFILYLRNVSVVEGAAVLLESC